MDWIAQALPFQFSANVASWNELLAKLPTASHESAAVHQIPLRKALTGPGVAWAVQEVPFHAAALSPVGPEPTTSQELAEMHDTPLTCENPVTAGPADQDDPFQIATCPKPLASMQKLVVTHETDIGCTEVPGIAWSCH